MKEDLSVADGNCGATEEAQRKVCGRCFFRNVVQRLCCQHPGFTVAEQSDRTGSESLQGYQEGPPQPSVQVKRARTRKLLPTMEQELFEIIKSRQACA